MTQKRLFINDIKEIISKILFLMRYYIFCYREWFDRLTCPLSSSWLFVNFNLSKEIGCFIQWAPLAGLSGCTWILGGDTGSARPATTQALLWNAYRYLLSSQGTKSITIRYSVLGSKPNSRHCRSSKSLSYFLHFAWNILNQSNHLDKIDITIF